ncbi:MAG: hypothetical protein LBQ22_11605 [Bacteroidales bacterium]|jgi:hypothetical protein|nr:hypothetical protein [Bacteroidales bacterium]
MKALLIFLFLGVLAFSSCNLKESCEMNHTGDICITNDNDVKVDIYVESVKVFELDVNETKCVTKPVGVYNIRCVRNTRLKEYNNIDLEECQKKELVVNFYE